MNSADLTRARHCRPAVVALGIALSVLASSAAWAQILGDGPVGTNGRIGRAAPKAEKPPEPAPDAIPGARARDEAAPARRPAGDMEPTEALFDSINRGDIASARDALNRGADLNGVNILGMTPMELSVDLGRNDISFLLLSMRGEDSGRGSRAVGRDPLAASMPAAESAQAGRQAARGRQAQSKAVQGASSAGKPLATPKLFANDGGEPVPRAGFLGFDFKSASN